MTERAGVSTERLAKQKRKVVEICPIFHHNLHLNLAALAASVVHGCTEW